ncbi:hypothetical protein PLESTB_000218900 [Pleodorina starrii]|uniref:DOT1 domain-containing protein n=1 Tax=Pleodorina starrii TaxID=330485 RepID=A0A9W6BCU7_9CHLO|nr:hypothetical protein PLESTM_001544600 [Pleodorina starrii]GLC49435.1 hypothetical protein PLESTB_000218900 [Pleodorina starrii]GLC75668.1 hypothetical protein PLESTF_001671900 [Pleodorina starrii]
MAAVARDRGGPKVDALYGLMQSYENKLGGGEGIEGLYGSITQASMQKVLDCLKHNSGLDARSVFVDIGAGLGRPLLHAMVSMGVSSAWGVELDRVKCDKAAAFCENVLHHLITQEVLASTVEVPSVICSPVEKVTSLDPSTHAYSFWEGVPPSGKQAFGELFAASRTLRAVAVVQRAIRGQEPAAMMRELGFGPVLLIANFPVKMSGSGRSFTAYVFTKIAPAAANFLANATGGAVAASAIASPLATQPRQGVKTPVGKQRVLPSSTAAASVGDDGADNKAPAPQLVSPSKARKPEAEPDPASPTKKPCAGAASAGAQGDKAAVQARLTVPAGRAKAVQQALTSLPAFSRRTKQGATAAGKAPGGKGAPKEAAPQDDVAEGEKAPTAARRSSKRLAAKAQAGAAAFPSAFAVEGC